MNKLGLLTFIFVALIISTLTGCSKDDDATPSAGQLTSGTWTFHSRYEDGEEFEAEGDEMNIKFDKDGTYTMTMVIFEEENVSEGTWKLTQKNTHLLLDEEGELKINKLDSHHLYLYNEEYDSEMRFVK